jgi:hypothetical protein
MALTHQGRAHFTASLDFELIANDQSGDHDDNDRGDGYGEAELAPGHMFTTASSCSDQNGVSDQSYPNSRSLVTYLNDDIRSTARTVWAIRA